MQPPPRPWAVPQARHNTARWMVVATCLAVIAAFGALGGIVGFADVTGRLDTRAQWAAPPAPPAQNAPASPISLSPGGAAVRAVIQLAVDHAVRSQAAALVAGDLGRYLADVEPANKLLVGDLTRRYTVLRAMGVGAYTEEAPSPPVATSRDTWNSDVDITYCFGAATCQPVAITVTSTWQVSGNRLLMVGLAHSDPGQMGPRPWEADDLVAVTGQRVVVATTRENAWRLPEAVRVADRAAAVADSLAKWDPPPSRYVIYLAGPAQWKTWYGHEQPDWAAGWAVEVGRTSREIMVRTQAVAQHQLEMLLTHELAHVTTLAGKRAGVGKSSWWLIEGVADYAAMLGKPLSEYDAYEATSGYVASGWDGDPAVTPPGADAGDKEAGARYGIAFLSVRRIAAVYGQDRMLDFFGRVVHDGATYDAAATGALGADWATVKADCAQYVRDAVA